MLGSSRRKLAKLILYQNFRKKEEVIIFPNFNLIKFLLWNAWKSGHIKKHIAEMLLEAQAACGGLIDARQNEDDSLEIIRQTNAFEAMEAGLFEDHKLAVKLQQVLDDVSGGVKFNNHTGNADKLAIYEVS